MPYGLLQFNNLTMGGFQGYDYAFISYLLEDNVTFGMRLYRTPVTPNIIVVPPTQLRRSTLLF